MIRMLKMCCLCCALMGLPAAATAELEVPDHSAPVEDATVTANQNFAAANHLDFDNDQDFEDARRGFLMGLDPLTVETCSEGASGHQICHNIWDLNKYEFLNPFIGTSSYPDPLDLSKFPKAPGSVNPSLWRQSILNSLHGVYQVASKIYQVRGYDLSNMSGIQGTSGWIIIDPLTTEETAAAALKRLQDVTDDHRGVSAVIFTHSHVDHYGGINGLGSLGAGVPIIAPEGFFEESVSENVIAGNAMGRRATYMYGPLLTKGETGQVDGGLGKTTPAGTTGIAKPNCEIGTGTGSCTGGISIQLKPLAGEQDGLVEAVVDGVTVWFQNVPGSEAPSEFIFYFPQFKALCAAEDVTHTFHNVLTPRGAKVRDSLSWSKYLHKTLAYFPDIDVIFASHHWPVWDSNLDGSVTGRVRELIEKQRDLYRYIHDQSVRLTNQGYTIQEVGEMVKLPESLGGSFYNRDYYGTVVANAKAVYQRYLGWFDANPASLNQLPPAEAAKEYVRYMGDDISKILTLAETDYANGKYRWVAMVLNHVVFSAGEAATGPIDFSDPSPDALTKARKLLADTYDQLAYQAESGPWRNFYLTGAMEMRNGVRNLPAVKAFTRDTVVEMPLDMVFDFLAIHVNGLEAGDLDYTFQLLFEGDDEGGGDSRPSVLYLKNGVLNYDVDKTIGETERTATLTMSRRLLNDIVMGAESPLLDGWICPAGIVTALEECILVEGGEGAVDAVQTFGNVMEPFEFWFPIVTPNPVPTHEPRQMKPGKARGKVKVR